MALALFHMELALWLDLLLLRRTASPHPVYNGGGALRALCPCLCAAGVATDPTGQ
jgi:hypothetical protein